MKQLLIFFLILTATAGGLFAGTKAKLTVVNNAQGNVLTIDKGADDGVAMGLRGSARRLFVDSMNGKGTDITVGEFIVTAVYAAKSEIFLESLKAGASPKSIEWVQFEKTLFPPDLKLSNWIRTVKEHMKDKVYSQSGVLLKKALELFPSNKELDLLDKGFRLLISEKISFENYIDYRKMKPDEFILNDLAEKLAENKKEPNLPPKKYLLDPRLTIVKNAKDYFEIVFPAMNNHVMIYIPGRKIFMDKYEVSTGQVMKAGIPINQSKFFSNVLQDYPGGFQDYPALMNYENAEKYCRKYDLRLPGENEWEGIAGKDADKDREYTWDDDNVADEAGVYRANFESLADGFLELAPIDGFTAYTSQYGAVNMSGNVSEWVNDRYAKGGNFMSDKEGLKITAKTRDPFFVGFRCVMEVEQ